MPFSDPKYRRSQRATPLLPKDRGGAGGEFAGASFTGAVFNLSTTIVGAGIMALPATLKQLGAIPGLITILLAGMLTEKSIEIILRFSKAAKTGSYSGLAADAFSGAGRNILQLCIVMNNVGMLVVYMIIIVHPIENELKDPSQMKSIVRTSITLCTSVYVATSFFGFLLFGNQTMDDVLANFDGELGIPFSSLLNDIVRVSYAIHLMLVFPIVFYSLRLNVDGILFPYAIPIAYDDRRFYALTIALMGFIFLGANFVPSIWDAFQFTGATATVSVGFIFPAAIALRCVELEFIHSLSAKKVHNGCLHDSMTLML
ncbi:UNVERIFIED_CONTAM: Amino acid transporter AVT6A [Sesamum radiatum]|uniref:Amino acid transporter AVT6A n=1 Tax=Sesamum radiatum TaxID=300843 RepID=A0AAW2Q0J3_SESRA